MTEVFKKFNGLFAVITKFGSDKEKQQLQMLQAKFDGKPALLSYTHELNQVITGWDFRELDDYKDHEILKDFAYTVKVADGFFTKQDLAAKDRIQKMIDHMAISKAEWSKWNTVRNRYIKAMEDGDYLVLPDPKHKWMVERMNEMIVKYSKKFRVREKALVQRLQADLPTKRVRKYDFYDFHTMDEKYTPYVPYKPSKTKDQWLN
jgi:hypothetical protein